MQRALEGSQGTMRALVILVLVIGGCEGREGETPVQGAHSPAKGCPPLPSAVPGQADIDPDLNFTGMEPRKGDAEGGTYVRIQGHRFIADGSRNAKVYFGSTDGTVVRFVSDNDLIVQAPGGKVGETVDVLINFQPGGQVKLKSAFTYVESR